MAKAGSDDVNEDLVERIFREVQTLMRQAHAHNPETVQAVAERLRIEVMVNKPSRHRRHVYQALIDYFEDTAHERAEQAHDKDKHSLRASAASYVRALIDGLDEE